MNQREIASPVAEATKKEIQDTSKQYLKYQEAIKNCYNTFEELEEEGNNLITGLKNLNLLKNLYSNNNSAETPDEIDIEAYQKFLEEGQIRDYYSKVATAARQGYDILMGFREFLTSGQQTFEYHILGSKGNVYELSHEQYMEYVVPLTVTYNPREWNKEIATNINLLEKLVLPLKDLDTTLANNQHINQIKNIPKNKGGLFLENVNEKDGLFDALEKLNKQRDKETSQARLFELYTQAKFFLDDEKDILDFFNSYIAEGLHSDNSPFYRIGDSIKNESVSIENKKTNSWYRYTAVISVNTIKNGIKKLYNIVVKHQIQIGKKNVDLSSEQDIENALVEFYVEEKKSGKSLTSAIQTASIELAEASIRETFKNIKINMT